MNEIQANILAILKKNQKPMSINEIAKTIQIDRHTAGRHLESLYSMGICSFEPKGKSKQWSLSQSPLLQILSKENPIHAELNQILSIIDEEITINTEDHEIIWANKEELATKKCYERVGHNGKPCAKCAVQDVFMTRRDISSTCNGKKIIAKPILGQNNQVVAVFAVRKQEKKAL